MRVLGRREQHEFEALVPLDEGVVAGWDLEEVARANCRENGLAI